MPKTSDFVGFRYPIIKTPKGYFAKGRGVDQIKADLLILLLTSPGERVNLPDFGTPLKDLIFDPNDATLANRANAMVAKAITDWEPRISVDQIEVKTGAEREILSPDDNLTERDAILTIRILFRDEEDITVQQDLVLEVPLPQG